MNKRLLSLALVVLLLVPVMARATNGTLVNSPTFITSAAGFGQAVQLNGSTQRVDLPATQYQFPSGTSWTLRGRFETTSTIADQFVGGCLFDAGICMLNGKLASAVNGIAGITGTTSCNDGAWHDSELDYNASTTTLYLFLDGTLQGTASGAYNLNSAGGASGIGCWGYSSNYTGSTYYWNGAIDEFASYNICLHTANFTPLSAPTSGTATGITSLYHFDVNANDATLGPATPGISVSPASIAASTSSNTVTITGGSTAWTSGTTFSVSGVSGTTITAQVG